MTARRGAGVGTGPGRAGALAAAAFGLAAAVVAAQPAPAPPIAVVRAAPAPLPAVAVAADGFVAPRSAVVGGFPVAAVAPSPTTTTAVEPAPAVQLPASSEPVAAAAGDPVPPAELRPAPFTVAAPDDRAAVAVAAAMAQIGLPYVWGGDGPMNGDAGFDCSGLTHYAYGRAGVPLPRTAHTQYYAARTYRRAPRCSRATWCSTGSRGGSTTWGCTSAPASW